MQFPVRWFSKVLALALVAAVVAGCGSSGSDVSIAPTKKVSYAVPATGCGSYTAKPPKDPDNVLPSLSEEAKTNVAGEPEIRKSMWSNFKPSSKPPYKVTVIMTGPINSLQTQLINGLKKKLKGENIGEVKILLTNGTDVPAQLQQFATATTDGTDLIVLEPLQPGAFDASIEKAGKKGIPTVTFLSLSESPYALNVGFNIYKDAANSTSFIARSAGGKGPILFVAGYVTTGGDISTYKGIKDVVKSCPDMSVSQPIVGLYANASAKAETIKYLSTHPEKLAGVVQGGTMAPGIISAFESTGRPVPPVQDQSAFEGSLAFWRDNRPDYNGIGSGPGPDALIQGVVDVANRTLAGDGPKVNKFFGPLPQITRDNLDDWVSKDAKQTSTLAANGPAGYQYLSPAVLDQLFNSK